MKSYKIIIAIMLLFCVLCAGCSSIASEAERLNEKYCVPFGNIIYECGRVTLETKELLDKGMINESEYVKRNITAMEKERYLIREVMDGLHKEEVSGEVKPLQETMSKMVRMWYDNNSRILGKFKKGIYFEAVSGEDIAFHEQFFKEVDNVDWHYKKLTGKERPRLIHQ